LITLKCVKTLLALVLIATSAQAQEQEQKLLDRLLKPNTTLENSAQKKKFVADRTSVNKRANVNAFYFEQKQKPKPFGGTRDYSAKEFNSKPYYAARDRSTFRTRSTSSLRTYSTSTSALVRASADANKAANTREFAEQRPFLDRGKSEKSVEFQRKNKPMSIEDVRELLNKNK
jgi:hypothetical protein